MDYFFSAGPAGFILAIAAAKRESSQNPRCAVHLCVVITKGSVETRTPPIISGYRLSDWFDDSTIHTFVNGDCKD